MITRPLCASLSLGLLVLTGCATGQQNAALECGAITATLAYALCKLGHGSDQQCLAISAGTGGGGALVCYAYADSLAKRRQALAGKENDLTARIQYVQGLNEDGDKLNAVLREQVAEAQKRSDDLLASVRDGQATSRQLAAEKKKLDDQISTAQAQAQSQQAALDEVKTYRQGLRTRSGTLDVAIAREENVVEATQSQVDALSRLRERVPS